MRPSRTRIAVIAGAASLALTLAACGSDSNDDAASTPTPTAAAASAPFGPACAAIPADVATAAPETAAADAAAKIPALSQLVSLVGAAGLAETINTTENITIFAPTNDAFAKVDKATLDALAADPKGALANVLKYHVVGETLTPENIAGSQTTLEGQAIEVTGSGTDWTVNGSAKVVCGNVKTKNATVYVIDSVLIPPTPTASPTS